MRDDLRGRLAPAHLSGFLLRRWGRSEYGEPRYRLVWAPSRVERSGGVWRADGGARLGVRWVRKYPGAECWLIEAWRPGWCYGSRRLWYSPVELGGTRLSTPWGAVCALGDFPARGDYEDIGARMYWGPSERHLEAAIGSYERGLLASHGLGARMHRATARAEADEARREEEFLKAAAEVMADAEPAFGGAPMASMSAERRRPALFDIAERAGVRAHPH